MEDCRLCRYGFRFRKKLLWCDVLNENIPLECWTGNDENHCDYYRGYPYDSLDGDDSERKPEQKKDN